MSEVHNNGAACTNSDNSSLLSSWHQEAIQFTVTYWELLEEQKSQLLDLRDRLQDIDHWKNTPDTVVRFLRARPGDVAAAETMFRNMIQWRKDFNVDSILQDYTPPAMLREYFPGSVLQGLDRENDPIYVGRIGVTDAAGLLSKYGEEELVRYSIWIRELVSRGDWMKEYEKDQGRPVKRVTIVEDLHDLSILHSSKAILSLYGKIMRLDQDNYCETGKRLIIVRAPFLFRAIWALVKHFFDAGVVAKMVFTGPSDYQSILEKYVEPSVLPPEIFPEKGEGGVALGMTYNFEGGNIPQEKGEM